MGTEEHMAAAVKRNLAALEEQETREKQGMQQTGEVLHQTDVPPWLERTKWMKYFRGLGMESMLLLADKPDVATEPALMAISEALDRLIEAAYHSVCEDKINHFA
jgi:hypothetical protein